MWDQEGLTQGNIGQLIAQSWICLLPTTGVLSNLANLPVMKGTEALLNLLGIKGMTLGLGPRLWYPGQSWYSLGK